MSAVALPVPRAAFERLTDAIDASNLGDVERDALLAMLEQLRTTDRAVDRAFRGQGNAGPTVVGAMRALVETFRTELGALQ